MTTSRRFAGFSLALVLTIASIQVLTGCFGMEKYECIPSGTWIMGSPATEPGHRANEEQHEITLTRRFEMKATEVTQNEFEVRMGYNPSWYSYIGCGPNRPVEQVSWYDALAYTNEISEADGLAACYSLTDIICGDGTTGDAETWCAAGGGIDSATVALNGVESVYDCEGFRLPTEAEWEYAARAGSPLAFPNGDISQVSSEPLDENLDLVAWYGGNANRTTHAVAGKAPNDWNLYDVLGNVKEWTWDSYVHDNTLQGEDPEWNVDGRYRVVRGGAARFHGAANTRLAFRSGHTPDHREMTLGFRPVRTLPSDAAVLRPSPPVSKHTESKLARKSRDWPDALPFDFTRPQIGDPLTPEEITAFTEAITSFWVDTHYFDRFRWLSHGMKADNPQGWPEFKLFYQDSWGVKTGDEVEITVSGNSDNLMIRTGKIFNNSAALYLATGDETAAHLVEKYCLGLVALMQGFEWSDDDPEPWIMPRTIFPQNYANIEAGGRRVFVNYEPTKKYAYDWNGWTIPNDGNPYYGDIWVRTHRSKDDVPHFYRMIPHLYRLIEEAPDRSVSAAAALALEYMEKWNKDIVNAGYYIRTKDGEGDTYVPMNMDTPYIVNDLASFVSYDPLAPGSECNAKLSSALIAYHEPLGQDCGDGLSALYDYIASYQHYFNDRNIIRIFHVDAVILALIHGYDDMANRLLEGLADRADYVFSHSRQEEERSYDADTASYLLACATAGLPLTNREVRHIHQEYEVAMDWYLDWPNWDPWDSSVPDGAVQIRPSDRMSDVKAVVRSTEMAYFIEYCSAPFRNPDSVNPVDCDVILDPSRWGGNR